MSKREREFSMLSEAERQLIDQEHTRLHQFLQDLHDVCIRVDGGDDCQDGCHREMIASCQGRLTSFLHDFLDLVALHFENEESIMAAHIAASGQDEQFGLHQAAHASLMREVSTLVNNAAEAGRRGHAAVAIRQLNSMIGTLFGHHAQEFDSAL